MRYIKAEHLLFRRTTARRLIVIAPVCTVVFATLSAGIINVQSTTLYWWYIFLLQGTIAVFCALSYQQEKRAGNFYGVYVMPINLTRYEFTKNLVIAGEMVSAGFVLSILLAIVHIVAPEAAIYQVNTVLCGSVGIVLISMWQIPLCLFLIRKLGFIFIVVGNTLIGIFTITIIGNTNVWFFWPYCWAAKFVEYVMKIGINGVMLDQKLQVSDIGKAFELLMASIVLFVVFSCIDANSFARKVGEGL